MSKDQVKQELKEIIEECQLQLNAFPRNINQSKHAYSSVYEKLLK
jgi:hypothetical protein